MMNDVQMVTEDLAIPAELKREPSKEAKAKVQVAEDLNPEVLASAEVTKH